VTGDAANPPVRRLADWPSPRLRDLVDAHGSPLYVVDLDRVRANYARVVDAFPDAEVLYAVKANAGRAVLETLSSAGAGAECASAGELARALEAGVDPGDVHYTAVNPPSDDLDYAVEVAAVHPDLTVTGGARDTVTRLADRGFTGRFCLRVHPGVGAGHSEAVATGADAKFGVPLDRAPAVIEEAERSGFDVVGLHAHVGSGMTDDDVDEHREMVSRLAALAADVDALEFVDVGGGFGVPYRPTDPPLDLDAVALATRDALTGVDAQLVVEPGRYLVADAGVLLAEVNTVKPAGDTVLAGVDAGMTTLLRPMLYDAYHHVANLARDADDRPERTVTVVGPICESTDVLASDRRLPRPRRGDVFAVGNAGAYGIEMANQYNSRPRPAVVALDGDEARVVRRRETIADITDTEVA
jgi:diaminopimelate decarboxylase